MQVQEELNNEVIEKIELLKYVTSKTEKNQRYSN